MKTLCSSHIQTLNKVATQLHNKQKMDYTQMILGNKNINRIEKAEQLIYKAMDILHKID
jgi:predicted secreted protein